MSEPRFLPYRPPRLSADEMLRRARAFYAQMDARRSVRDFAPDPVPRELIELAIRTAATAPSGAHRQPWRFVAVDDPEVKREIRVAAEAEERDCYEGGRMSEEWLRRARAARHRRGRSRSSRSRPGWSSSSRSSTAWPPTARRARTTTSRRASASPAACSSPRSTAMGLATLTHTPSPMAFLSRILGRPAEREAVHPLPGRLPGPGRGRARPQAEGPRRDRRLVPAVVSAP